MKKIHCISGLGADERIFQKLSIPGVELVHVPWAAYDKHDEIPCYAQKMSAKIKEENPVILGVSFGGMLAVEIAKLRNVDRVFIVSSAKTKGELAQKGIGAFIASAVKSDLVPPALLTMPNWVLLNRFGVTNKEEKELLTAILNDTDPHFAKWAMRSLLMWANTTYTENVVHLHGTNDKIIPSANVHPHVWIEDGTHLMIYNKAEEISKIIGENL